MKKITLMCGMFLSVFTSVNAQDTTANRLLIIENWPSSVIFLKNDSTFLHTQNVQGVDAGSSSSHALFTHPQNNKLYAVVDSSSFTSRAVYEINPLNGAKTLIYDHGEQFASVEITDSGRVFGITGNGGPVPGGVYELDLVNQTKTLRYTSMVPAGEPRALGFNPATQELLVFSSFLDTVYKTPLNNWTAETRQYLDMSGEEVHGALYQPATGGFLLSTYGNDVLFWNGTSATTSYTSITIPSSLMDLAEAKFIDTISVLKVCANETININLNAIHTSASYKWYHNGVAIPSSNMPSINVTATGTYQLLSQADTNYIWSETITVQTLPAPVVSISGNDTLICSGDTIMLSGSTGGTSQWYMNGVMIPGATSATYPATAPGSYNMTKTNTNGCVDSSATAYVITMDTPANCGTTGITEATSAKVAVYPNPFSNSITINATGTINRVEWIDMTGRTVKTISPNASTVTVDASGLSEGVYFLATWINGEKTVTRIVK